MFSLICVWANGWVNSGGAGDLRRYRAHYDAIVMTDRAALKLKIVLKELCQIYKMSISLQIRIDAVIIWQLL